MTAHDPDPLNNSVFFEQGAATSICGAVRDRRSGRCRLRPDRGGRRRRHGRRRLMGAGLLEANRVPRDRQADALRLGRARRSHRRADGGAGHPHGSRQCSRAASASSTPTPGSIRLAERSCTPLPRRPRGRVGARPLFTSSPTTNIFTHTGIDAALTLSPRHPARGRRTRELSVPVSVTRTIAEPREAECFPGHLPHAQLLRPLHLTPWPSTADRVSASTSTTSPTSRSPTLDPTSRRCATRPTPSAERPYFPRHFPTIARVRLVNGTAVTEKVLTNLGTTERPLTPEQLALKFALHHPRPRPGRSGPRRGPRRAAHVGDLSRAARRHSAVAGSTGVAPNSVGSSSHSPSATQRGPLATPTSHRSPRGSRERHRPRP